jgi:hypothetical protein
MAPSPRLADVAAGVLLGAAVQYLITSQTSTSSSSSSQSQRREEEGSSVPSLPAADVTSSEPVVSVSGVSVPLDLVAPVFARISALDRKKRGREMGDLNGCSLDDDNTDENEEAEREPEAKLLEGEEARLTQCAWERAIAGPRSIAATIDLDAIEARRVWAELVQGKPVEERGSVTLAEFTEGLSRLPLLRTVVEELASTTGNSSGGDENATAFEVPVDYDFSRSTNDNYGVDDREFVGEFAEIRKTLDYAYHTNYTHARQLWQDKLIRSVIKRVDPQPHPWVVYTCGPMVLYLVRASQFFLLSPFLPHFSII